MVTPDDISFIPADPGWEVLTYVRDGEFESTPIAAWATVCEGPECFIRAFPVTMNASWSMNDDRAVWLPDGSVVHGDARWPTVGAWLDDVAKLGSSNGRTSVSKTENGGSSPSPQRQPGVLALDQFRNKFQRE